MKAKDFPMKNSVLFKNFDESGYFTYNQLSTEEKEYDITLMFYKVIGTERRKIYVIASRETMELFRLKPRKFKAIVK